MKSCVIVDPEEIQFVFDRDVDFNLILKREPDTESACQKGIEQGMVVNIFCYPGE